MAELVDMKSLERPVSVPRETLSGSEDGPAVDTDPESDELPLAWPVSLYVTEDAVSSPESLSQERKRFIRQATVEHRKNVIGKNVAVVCVVFILSYIALLGVIDLRLALKDTAKVFNVIEFGLFLGAMALGLMFVSPLVVVKFGYKTSMAVGLMTVILYAVANLYVHWGTVMPTVTLLGVGLSCMWTALGVYITKTGRTVSDLSGYSSCRAVNTLFGLFYLALSITTVCGSLITAFVIYDTRDMTASIPPDANCGAFYSPTDTDNFTTQALPDTVQLYTLRGTHVLLGVLALVTLCLCLGINGGKSKKQSANQGNNVIEVREEAVGEIFTKKTSCREILPLATLFQLVRRDQIFLTPITVYSGLQVAFFVWDICQSYVNCTLGVWLVTIATACWAGTSGLSSCIFGRLVSRSGRIPLFVCGALVQCGVLLALFLWQPHYEQLPVFFVISGLWGVSDGIWQCLISGLYASVFHHEGLEAAFASYHLWRIVGVGAAVIYGHFLATYIKIFTLLSVLSLGMMGYFAVEVPLYRRGRS